MVVVLRVRHETRREKIPQGCTYSPPMLCAFLRLSLSGSGSLGPQIVVWMGTYRPMYTSIWAKIPDADRSLVRYRRPGPIRSPHNRDNGWSV